MLAVSLAITFEAPITLPLPPQSKMVQVCSRAVRRRPPAIDSQTFVIKEIPGIGFGAFARRDILAGTVVLVEGVAIHAVTRESRKRACARCFAVAPGLPDTEGISRCWPIRDVRCGVAFCSEECQEEWYDTEGKEEFVRDAYSVVEELIAASRNWSGRSRADKRPRPKEIEECWKRAEHSADLIREARTVGRNESLTDAQRNAIQRSQKLEISEHPEYSPHRWKSFMSLHTSPTPYCTPVKLRFVVDCYLTLLSVLPKQLLSSTTPGVIHALVARDEFNIFGIWNGIKQSGWDEDVGTGFWVIASYFNHSCSPNLDKKREGRSYVFRAKRDIGRGEELRISYLGVKELREGREERRRMLSEWWGFRCGCARCGRDEAVKYT